jgi:uncharacterized protein YceK
MRLLIVAVICCTSVGCGTLHNLDAPAMTTQVYIGPSTCAPLGGFARSALLGGFGTAAGVQGTAVSGWTLLQGDVSDGCKGIGDGLWLTGVGLGSLVDTPISLAADIVTLPVVIARRQQQPWASWESGVITSWIQLFPTNAGKVEKSPGTIDKGK